MSDLSPEASTLAIPPQALSAAEPRTLGATPAYWFCMFAASALGTNLGDFTVDTLSLARGASFALLAAITVAAIWGDGKYGGRAEAGYWIAIVTLRAAATNVSDFLTHDLRLGYVAATTALGIATLCAGAFTRIGRGGTPLIDGRYWIAMLIAGIFGTTGGDLAAHTLGLYAASAVLCGTVLIVLAARSRFAATSALGYWCIVLAERCAGTPVGDGLASYRAIGLGLPLAMVCTCALLAIALLTRAARRAR